MQGSALCERAVRRKHLPGKAGLKIQLNSVSV
jgi:hypothetical protein